MFAQLPMYQQRGRSAFNSKLDNILGLAAHLEQPQKKFKSIHVGGTNGKGSSSHMLASILQEAGYKVGLYTSPHLKDFRERIRINGKTVGKKFVVDFIETNKDFFNQNQLSFFEMTVGMAFSYFAEQKVDIAIIEVGLGGRLDSTNIIVPEVSLITNIGFDHIDMLGDSLEKIAMEKAGIIKQNIPVVISETQIETKGIFWSIASEKGSKLLFADEEIHKTYPTDLLGNYQSKNIKGVLGTINMLKGFEVRTTHIIDGLKKVTHNTGLIGRWQVLAHNPKIICDTAHNKEGLSLVMQQLLLQEYKALHVVIGFVKGKDLTKLLPLLPKTARYYFCSPNVERGLNVSILKEQAATFGLKGRKYKSVKSALNAAKKRAHKNDFIFVGGSNFVVAEAL